MPRVPAWEGLGLGIRQHNQNRTAAHPRPPTWISGLISGPDTGLASSSRWVCSGVPPLTPESLSTFAPLSSTGYSRKGEVPRKTLTVQEGSSWK